MSEDWQEQTEVAGIGEFGKERSITSELKLQLQERAALIVLLGSDAGRTISLDEQEIIIGRTPDAKICLPNDDVSRQHALIKREGDHYVIQDLESTNGTVVNGVPIKKQILQLGDKIRIGAKAVYMFTHHDILEDQLLQAQRLESIGLITGGVAHDFNNIIGSILANVGFLKNLSLSITFDDQEVRDCLNDIDLATRRAADLSRQLLDYARKDSTTECTIELDLIVKEVVTLISRTVGRSINIDLKTDPKLIVNGYPSELHQMLMNLCINACDAMSNGGILSISLQETIITEEELPGMRAGSYVKLTMEDNGCGMSEETQKRAFEPFFTTKKHGKGTGLGLASVRDIVKKHMGHIQLTSTLGQGTCFTIYLPLCHLEPTSYSSIPATEFMPHRTQDIVPITVLLVDDEPVFLNGTRRLLEGMGYFVKCASSGAEAIEIYQKHREVIELVILDLVMPEFSGVETFAALKQIHPSLKILITSGQTDSDCTNRLLAAGAQGFLQKPFDAEAVGKAISEAILD